MTIRNYISIILFLAAQLDLTAQKDTSFQTVRVESGSYTTPVIETPADRIFRSKVPSKWMFKLDLSRSIRSIFQIEFPLTVGAEYKVAPAFSIGAYYNLSFNSSPYDIDILTSSSISVEGRWYHDMKKRIKSGRSANNFGGKYLGLETSIFKNEGQTGNWDRKRLALRYGLQQRLFTAEYFDISLGAGVYHGDIRYNRWPFGTDYRMAVGLAVFMPNAGKTSQEGGLCDVLHCQEEQVKMLKINLFDAVNFRLDGSNYFNFNVKPNIGFEHKIGRSPFSFEVELEGAYDMVKFDYVSGQVSRSLLVRSGSVNTTAELRWYYSMRRRILNGRSGNNLSGVFAGIQCNRNNIIKNTVHVRLDDIPNLPGYEIPGNYWTANVVWGIQQRLFDRGFIQFKVGAGSTLGGQNYRYEGSGKSYTKIDRKNELNILADLKVGFAF